MYLRLSGCTGFESTFGFGPAKERKEVSIVIVFCHYVHVRNNPVVTHDTNPQVVTYNDHACPSPLNLENQKATSYQYVDGDSSPGGSPIDANKSLYEGSPTVTVKKKKQLLMLIVIPVSCTYLRDLRLGL